MATQVNIGGKKFSCVTLSESDFKDIAAVYVILCVAQDRSWSVLDVGQTGEVGDRIDDHDRKECWQRNCPNRNIWVCIYPMPSSQYSRQDREKFESYLRNQYQPQCGKR
ncbi:MAG TPA: hypothetical protein ENO18_01690 [Caldithrix sp.]|nr:hypothetical protein [Caldithrix sp.]